MSIVIGTNAGFVSSAPSADPSGGGVFTCDRRSTALQDTTSSGITTITEIGWWCDNATEAADFEVGIYEDDGGAPGDLVSKSTGHAKGTDAGWKSVTGLSISVSASTTYWIAVQLDNTATGTQTDREFSGSANAYLEFQTELPDPFGTPDGTSDDPLAFYAVESSGPAPSGPPVGTLSIWV